MAKSGDSVIASDSPQASSRASSKRASSPAAQRALAEAELRRKTQEEHAAAAPRELNGRQGPDPVRYGDWENKGIASDF